MDEYCIVKQRAGPLVKVFSTDRACFLRKNGECIRSRCRAGNEPHDRRPSWSCGLRSLNTTAFSTR